MIRETWRVDFKVLWCIWPNSCWKRELSELETAGFWPLIMYRLSGRLGESGGRRAQLSNRQLPTLNFCVCIHCLCSLFCVWPVPGASVTGIVSPGSKRQGGGPGSGVRDNNCYLFSITNTFCVNCHHQPATWSLLGTWKVVKTILWFINKSWMFKTQSYNDNKFTQQMQCDCEHPIFLEFRTHCDLIGLSQFPCLYLLHVQWSKCMVLL